MSQFHPTTRIIEAPNQSDQLAQTVLNSLTRPIYYELSWSAPVAFVMSIVTLGIAPILTIRRWMRDLIVQHQQQLWYLAEWLRLESNDPRAIELQQTTSRIRYNWNLARLSLIMVLIAIVMLINQLLQHGFAYPPIDAQLVFGLFITAAALCNWLHLIQHQINVDRFVVQFNSLGMEQIPRSRLELGLAPIWIIGGAILAWQGVWWGLPVMVAAGAHRRYTSRQSIMLRSILAQRLRAMLETLQPGVDVPKPVTAVRVCSRGNCRAPLLPDANFCPRCGTRVARWMDLVA